VWVPRPFAGLASEPDLVALREVVPSATVPLTLTADPARTVTLVTVLPMAWAALHRRDGQVFVSLQTPQRSGDLGLDLGQALQAALDSEPGSFQDTLPVPAEGGARLFDLVGDTALDVTVHEDFDWWFDAETMAAGLAGEVKESMEQANSGIVPTARLTSVSAAYWCRMGERTHLRWALPEDEDQLLDAFARLHVAGGLSLGEGTRYVGAFRALGILVPVWDLANDSEAKQLDEPALAFRGRLDEALAATAPLTGEERRARAGVVGRQVTLR
jgi:hypothetical protein